MKDTYRRIAGSYDILFSSALRQLRVDIRTYIYHKNYSRIIDICCGTGCQLHLLERPGMQLYGIDNSLSMLEKATNVCSDRTELHLLDAGQESFPPGSFDGAILSLALHDKHPAAARTIYKNSYKLIKDGGSLIIADLTPPAPGFGSWFIGRCIIPLFQRFGGSGHYERYSWWLESGGLEHFVDQFGAAAEVISRPLNGNILCCAIVKNEAQKTAQQNFGLLDLNLRSQVIKKEDNDS